MTLTNLESLQLSINSHTRTEFSSLTGMTKLRELQIVGEGDVFTNVSFLNDLSELVTLIFHDIKLDVEDMSFLKQLPNLEYLGLGNTTLPDDQLETLRRAWPGCLIVN